VRRKRDFTRHARSCLGAFFVKTGAARNVCLRVSSLEFSKPRVELFFVRGDASLGQRAEMVSTSSSCTMGISISLSTSPVLTAPMSALPL